MSSEKLFFSQLKEDRGWYFVEYQPPHPDYRFAMLSVVMIEPAMPPVVAEAMEVELTTWLKRYPVPLMVSAFDANGDLYQMEGVRSSDHLMGYLDAGANKASMFWRTLTDEEIPGEPLANEFLLRVYEGVPFKTSAQTRQTADEEARKLRIGWMIVFAWAVVVPGIWAILEWAGPACLGGMVLFCSLCKAGVKTLQLLGKWKYSPEELKRQEEERRKDHHHYHCERNPDGFMRLKLENFEREERERIQTEAKALKASR